MKKIIFIMNFISISFLLISQNIEMVKDINPNGGSFPDNFSICTYKESMSSTPTKLFFTANDGSGIGVFMTNGTNAGTIKLLSNITNASNFTTYNGLNFYVQLPTVLFFAENSTYGKEIWKTNGTTNNTQLLKDIYPGTTSSNPTNIVVFNWIAYFAATSSPNLRSIYKCEASQATTEIAVPFNTGWNSMISQLFKFNNKLIFPAFTNQYGVELWVSDGTEAGTALLKDINSGALNAFDTLYGGIKKIEMVEFNNKLYFSAKNSSNNFELWVTNGTTSGTLCVKEINPNGGSNPKYLTVCNNKLYFVAYDGNEYGLYESDGSINNADKKLSLGTFSPNNLYLLNDEIYYFTNTGLLRKYNTITSTATDVMQFNPIPYGVYWMINYNGYLYFRVYQNNNYQLWRTDGTTANTTQILPPNSTNSGSPGAAMVFDGSLYISANFDNAGQELWKITDSTTLLPPTFSILNVNTIYPNPSSDFLHINSLQSKYFHFYDILGVKQLTVKNEHISINISMLKQGMYIVYDDNFNLIGKFFKK